MKKIFLTILFTLVLSGSAYAEEILIKCNSMNSKTQYQLIEYKINEDERSLFNTTIWVEKGKKKTYQEYLNIISWNETEVIYTFPKYDNSYKYKINYSSDKFLEWSIKDNSAWSECNKVKKNYTSANNSIEFNIAEKKQQCEAIGFKPETEKFADCVLRLVELDVKQQTQNQIVSAQNSGNNALVKQLERQNNLQSSQALIDLGQQLMKPKQYNSNIYMPQTRRCTVSGFGVTSVVRCY